MIGAVCRFYCIRALSGKGKKEKVKVETTTEKFVRNIKTK
jgi:hypothetical protein